VLAGVTNSFDTFFSPSINFFISAFVVFLLNSSNSPIPNLSKHSPSLYFLKSMLSLDYPKPPVVAYEKTMPLSIFSLWFLRFQPFALNLVVIHLVTSTVVYYP
jgi:hypothetical protein